MDVTQKMFPTLCSCPENFSFHLGLSAVFTIQLWWKSPYSLHASNDVLNSHWGVTTLLLCCFPVPLVGAVEVLLFHPPTNAEANCGRRGKIWSVRGQRALLEVVNPEGSTISQLCNPMPAFCLLSFQTPWHTQVLKYLVQLCWGCCVKVWMPGTDLWKKAHLMTAVPFSAVSQNCVFQVLLALKAGTLMWDKRALNGRLRSTEVPVWALTILFPSSSQVKSSS